MMKTLKMLAMALVAIAICGAFAACSDDDDEGIGKTSSKGKRLVSFAWDEVENGETSVDPYTWNVTYDSDGRVVALISPNHVRSYYYTWGNNTLREEWYYEGELEEQLTFYITNGLVSRYTVDNWCEISYEYDSHDRLVSVDIPERGDERTAKVLWEDGLLVKYEMYEDQSSEPWLWTTCYYNGQTCSGYNPLFLEYYSGFDCFHDDDAAWFAFVYPEMFGLRTNALPYMLEDEYGRRNITYEFDKDNYITKITDSDSHYAMIYWFEWE